MFDETGEMASSRFRGLSVAAEAAGRSANAVKTKVQAAAAAAAPAALPVVAATFKMAGIDRVRDVEERAHDRVVFL